MRRRYDFEYEEDEDEDSGDVDIENKYYNAKQLKLSSPEEAVDEFVAIPQLEPEKGEWGFKGLKQAIKLEFKLGRYSEVCFSDVMHNAAWLMLMENTYRQQTISKSSSPTSNPLLHETTLKNPSTIC